MKAGDTVHVFVCPRSQLTLVQSEPVMLKEFIRKDRDELELWNCEQSNGTQERFYIAPCKHKKVRVVTIPNDPDCFEIVCSYCGDKLEADTIKLLALGEVELE